MLQFFPSPLNPLCQQIANERECRANEKCTWCNGGQCLYKMEGKRLENDCSNDPMQDDAQDDIGKLPDLNCMHSIAL